MCPISFNIYKIKSNNGHFSSGTVNIHYWDKPYQERNFKSHWNTVIFVNKGKYCQICTCSVWFNLILFVCAHCYNEIKRGKL